MGKDFFIWWWDIKEKANSTIVLYYCFYSEFAHKTVKMKAQWRQINCFCLHFYYFIKKRIMRMTKFTFGHEFNTLKHSLIYVFYRELWVTKYRSKFQCTLNIIKEHCITVFDIEKRLPDEKTSMLNPFENEQEKWYSIAMELIFPFMIAGLGMVLAGLVLEHVKVF